MFCLRRFSSLNKSIVFISRSTRPIHLSTRWKTQEKKSVIRTQSKANEISEKILRRLDFRDQRGLVKALIIGSGIVVVSSVVFLYVFRKPLKNQTVAQVADVAKSSLEQGEKKDKLDCFSFLFFDEYFLFSSSEKVRQQVNVLTQELIQNLLSDPTILAKVLTFLERLMDDPSTKQTLIRLLQRLMIDVEMQRYVSEFTSRIVYDVMNKPETEIQLAQLFRRAILQKDNQDALYILLKEFIDAEKTRDVLTSLALDVTHRVLNDENVKTNATNFAKDVLNDAGLQQQSGDFAWNAFKNAIKPRWFTTQANPIDNSSKK